MAMTSGATQCLVRNEITIIYINRRFKPMEIMFKPIPNTKLTNTKLIKYKIRPNKKYYGRRSNKLSQKKSKINKVLNKKWFFKQ